MNDGRITTFADRLKEAMQIRDIKPVDLAKKAGVDKSNISQWTKGVYEARQRGVYALAKALNVSEAWLMGFDVPITREPRSGEEKLIIPEELKGAQVAFHRGEFEDLTQAEIDALAAIAKTFKDQRKGGSPDDKA